MKRFHLWQSLCVVGEKQAGWTKKHLSTRCLLNTRERMVRVAVLDEERWVEVWKDDLECDVLPLNLWGV